MLGLVDYDGSDSEENEQCDDKSGGVTAVIVSNPKKGVNVIGTSSNTAANDIKLSSPNHDTGDDGLIGSSLLASLPSVSLEDAHPKFSLDSDDVLEDIVKRKEWELRRMKHFEKKKKKLEKRRKKEAKKRKVDEDKSEKLLKPKKNKKKKVKIEAFGELPELTRDSDGLNSDDEVHVATKLSDRKLTGLLALLPQPKNERTVGKSKTPTILLPSNLRQQQRADISVKNSNMSEKESKPLTSTEHAGSGSDVDVDGDSIDFFGLKNEDAKETADSALETRISTISYGPVRPETMAPHETNIPVSDEIVSEIEPSCSGVIDDSEAARLIYSHDIAPYGGSERDADASVSNIVDVSVDQALGPNIRANLLKNLHNKSLAEAAIAHLSRIPKAKDAKDVVARRKHQITYLATVAVAREEQLAEQWSQNRHAKRMSAQKYGF